MKKYIAAMMLLGAVVSAPVFANQDNREENATKIVHVINFDAHFGGGSGVNQSCPVGTQNVYDCRDGQWKCYPVESGPGQGSG